MDGKYGLRIGHDDRRRFRVQPCPPLALSRPPPYHDLGCTSQSLPSSRSLGDQGRDRGQYLERGFAILCFVSGVEMEQVETVAGDQLSVVQGDLVLRRCSAEFLEGTHLKVASLLPSLETGRAREKLSLDDVRSLSRTDSKSQQIDRVAFEESSAMNLAFQTLVSVRQQGLLRLSRTE